MTKSCVPWICFLKWQFINSTITHMWETSSHPWHLNTVQVSWHLPPPSIFSLFEMTGKKTTNHRFNGFNKFTPSGPICSTQYSFETPDRPSSGQQSRSDRQSLKVQVLWASVLQWLLSEIGTSLSLGSFKCTSEKSFFPCKGKQESHSSNPVEIWLRSFFCPMSSGLCFCFLVFVFFQWSKRPKSNLSYKKQDSDGYKGSDQEQRSLLSLPHPIYVLHRKTKKQVHKTQQLKLQKSIHPRAVGGRRGKWKGNGTGREYSNQSRHGAGKC